MDVEVVVSGCAIVVEPLKEHFEVARGRKELRRELMLKKKKKSQKQECSGPRFDTEESLQVGAFSFHTHTYDHLFLTFLCHLFICIFLQPAFKKERRKNSINFRISTHGAVLEI